MLFGVKADFFQLLVAILFTSKILIDFLDANFTHLSILTLKMNE